MQRNKSLRLRPRCSTAFSGEAAKLGRQDSTGLARLAARWCCTGVVGISRSTRCGRPGAADVWWPGFMLLLFLLDRWKRQSRGQRSTGFVPGRCSGTRSQFSSVGMRLRCGSQSHWMAMVLLPLTSWPSALPCSAVAESMAAGLKEGVNAIYNLVMDVLNKRMSTWEMYCLRKCLTVPEGFVAPEDDNSSAMVLHKDGNSDSELDAELNFFRKKLADANTESEELQREFFSLERQSAYKSNLNSSVAEVLKLFEDKSVQENIQALVNTIPKLHQEMKVMKRKKVELEAMVGQNVWNVNCLRDQKRLALGSTSSTEDIQEVNVAVNGLQKE